MQFRDRWVRVSMFFRNRWILFWKRKHRVNVKKSKALLKKLQKMDQMGARIFYLRKVSAYVFEEFILTLFESKGFAVWRSPSYSGDGGVDGKVWIESVGWVAIQSKRYCGLVKPVHVKNFVEVSKGFAAGIFVHSGKTSDFSRDHALSSNVYILSGNALVNSIDDGNLQAWTNKHIKSKKG